MLLFAPRVCLVCGLKRISFPLHTAHVCAYDDRSLAHAQNWVHFLNLSDASNADRDEAEGLTQDDIRFAPQRIAESLDGLEVDHAGALAVCSTNSTVVTSPSAFMLGLVLEVIVVDWLSWWNGQTQCPVL